MRSLDVEPTLHRGDARELRFPEGLDFLDVTLRVEKGHVREVRRIDAEPIPAMDFMVALRVGEVQLEQRGEVLGAAASRGQREDEIFRVRRGGKLHASFHGGQRVYDDRMELWCRPMRKIFCKT